MEKESRCWGKPQREATGRISQKEKAAWLDKDLRTVFPGRREKENVQFISSLEKWQCLPSFPKCWSMGWFVQHFACASSYLVLQHRKSKKNQCWQFENQSSDCGNEIFVLPAIKKQANQHPKQAKKDSTSISCSREGLNTTTRNQYCHHCRYQ